MSWERDLVKVLLPVNLMKKTKNHEVSNSYEYYIISAFIPKTISRLYINGAIMVPISLAKNQDEDAHPNITPLLRLQLIFLL
jgi:hypothetical protein